MNPADVVAALPWAVCLGAALGVALMVVSAWGDR